MGSQKYFLFCFQVTDRGMILTKDSLIKMETGKKFKVAVTIPLVDVMKLSLSPDAGNQVVIIQLRGKGHFFSEDSCSLKIL